MAPKAQPTAGVVYTAVFGDFEKVWPPVRADPLTEYLMVSDSDTAVPGWELVQVDSRSYSSPRLANRHQKMLFHTELPTVSASLYIDGNVRPTAPLDPLFSAFIASGADLGMYRHYARTSVRDEARACVARDKVDNVTAVEKELAFYATQGFPDTEGMWEGSVILKNHRSPKVVGAMEEWWSLYSRFQTRDQFSLPFVIWRHGLEVFDLDSVGTDREMFFARLQHSTTGVANKLARYTQARAPENAVWALAHGLGRAFSQRTRVL